MRVWHTTGWVEYQKIASNGIVKANPVSANDSAVLAQQNVSVVWLTDGPFPTKGNIYGGFRLEFELDDLLGSDEVIRTNDTFGHPTFLIGAPSVVQGLQVVMPQWPVYRSIPYHVLPRFPQWAHFLVARDLGAHEALSLSFDQATEYDHRGQRRAKWERLLRDVEALALAGRLVNGPDHLDRLFAGVLKESAESAMLHMGSMKAEARRAKMASAGSLLAPSLPACLDMVLNHDQEGARDAASLFADEDDLARALCKAIDDAFPGSALAPATITANFK